MLLKKPTISLGREDICPWNKTTVQSPNYIRDADTDRPREGEMVRGGTHLQIPQGRRLTAAN